MLHYSNSQLPNRGAFPDNSGGIFADWTRRVTVLAKNRRIDKPQRRGVIECSQGFPVIKRIELINFMSHEHTVIEPAAGLTVLVGPNNCGKSAIVTALQILCHNDNSTYVLLSLIHI